MTSSEADSPLLLFSVIIPTRHRNDLLALCLDRLAPGAQTLDPSRYEVIVTDDGSQSTAEQMIAQRYPWARWTPGPRKGPAANRNNGAAHARAEWLAFTDDDCLPERGWLAAFAAAIHAMEYVRVLEGRTTCSSGLRSPLQSAPINLTGGWLWSCNMAVRRDTLTELGGFDEAYPHPHMEDADLRERLRARDIEFPFTPEATVDHPPRQQPKGRLLGAHKECEVIFLQKQGQKARLLPLLYRTARYRIKFILATTLSRDTARAVWSLIEELTVVTIRFRRWNRGVGPSGGQR